MRLRQLLKKIGENLLVTLSVAIFIFILLSIMEIFIGGILGIVIYHIVKSLRKK